MIDEFGAWFDIERLWMSRESYTREEFAQYMAEFSEEEISAYLKIATGEGVRRGRWHEWHTKRRDLYRNDEHLGLK